MLKEKIKLKNDTTVAFVEQTLGVGALKRFIKIQQDYDRLNFNAMLNYSL